MGKYLELLVIIIICLVCIAWALHVAAQYRTAVTAEVHGWYECDVSDDVLRCNTNIPEVWVNDYRIK